MEEVAVEARRTLTAIQEANVGMAKKLQQVAAPGQVSSTRLPFASHTVPICVAPSRAGRCPPGVVGSSLPTAGAAGAS